MKYGFPYKGSKNKLAERIVRFLPEAEHFIDLFCGGCAVSHAALLRGKWPHVHINDADWRCPELFVYALEGKYAGERRWVSREDFERLKLSDPYVACVWSFGNNMRNYLYSRDREPLKRAVHYAVFFADYGPAAALGHDLSFLGGIRGASQRYAAVRRYFAQTAIGQGGRLQNAEKGMRPVFHQKKDGGFLLENLGRQRRLEGLADGVGKTPLPRLTSSSLDYAAVAIPRGSVVYCDIPYIGTDVYNTDGGGQFDYERFYQWAESQTEPVFVSSYQMPPGRFECVAEWAHRTTLCATANLAVRERIFVPRGQMARGNVPPVPPSLFDD